MDFRLEEQALIVQTVRRFAERDLRGWAADAEIVQAARAIANLCRERRARCQRR
jgi:hypothetical protein